jgi:hypothetical protein
MFGAAISGLNNILARHPWARELAGILPLSALIDFIDVPQKLHVLELTGAVPLWNWPVTPAGSRILLSDEYTQKTCFLDRHGSSLALIALDGRYGEQYVISSPETVRMCISSMKECSIKNDHENMSGKDLRIQNLEIVHVSVGRQDQPQPSQSWFRKIFLAPWLVFSHGRMLISATGWIMLLGMIIMSGVLQCYLSLAFLIAIPVTGVVIFCLYGTTPRRLLVQKDQEEKAYNRMIVVAEHMNSIDWIVFYGESTTVNSLLNRPLEPLGPRPSKFALSFLRTTLRILTLGQWGLALGAAALKDWNAYFITFWIVFCIISHAYLIPPLQLTNDWMKSRANISISRYQTQLSSRRALLNTIIALNPDTFPWNHSTQQDDRTKLYDGAMKWVDPILASGPSRTKWEAATRTAMDEALQQYTPETLASSNWRGRKGEGLLSQDWNQAYPFDEKAKVNENFWKPFILEGIHMAAKIKKEAGLPGRVVAKVV